MSRGKANPKTKNIILRGVEYDKQETHKKRKLQCNHRTAW